jgi:putative transcriptional regulator
VASSRRRHIGLRAPGVAGLALALVLIAAIPPGTEAGRPAAGRLLIATRQVGGPFFAESIVLLLEHDAGGAVGLILNRRSSVVLGTLIPERAGPELAAGPVHIGGPVSASTLLLLFRGGSETAPLGARRVLANLYVGAGDETLGYLRSLDAPVDRVRAYLGYAGWAAGQLEQEIARGDWIVVPGQSKFVFHAQPATLWPELIAKYGGIWAGLPRDSQRPPPIAGAGRRTAQRLAQEMR